MTLTLDPALALGDVATAAGDYVRLGPAISGFVLGPSPGNGDITFASGSATRVHYYYAASTAPPADSTAFLTAQGAAEAVNADLAGVTLGLGPAEAVKLPPEAWSAAFAQYGGTDVDLVLMTELVDIPGTYGAPFKIDITSISDAVGSPPELWVRNSAPSTAVLLSEVWSPGSDQISAVNPSGGSIIYDIVARKTTSTRGGPELAKSVILDLIANAAPGDAAQVVAASGATIDLPAVGVAATGNVDIIIMAQAADNQLVTPLTFHESEFITPVSPFERLPAPLVANLNVNWGDFDFTDSQAGTTVVTVSGCTPLNNNRPRLDLPDEGAGALQQEVATVEQSYDLGSARDLHIRSQVMTRGSALPVALNKANNGNYAAAVWVLWFNGAYNIVTDPAWGGQGAGGAVTRTIETTADTVGVVFVDCMQFEIADTQAGLVPSDADLQSAFNFDQDPIGFVGAQQGGYVQTPNSARRVIMSVWFAGVPTAGPGTHDIIFNRGGATDGLDAGDQGVSAVFRLDRIP